jgi:hypothetical protein
MLFSTKHPPKDFYVYAYLREHDSPIGKAGTPYYIGKGCGKRAWSTQHNILPPKNKSCIQILAHRLLDQESKLVEVKLIKQFGRVDQGTGILRN